MKKILILILTILFTISAVSCSDNLINDADSGEITIPDKKYSYTDGTYYAGYDYHDCYGYCPAAKVIIEGGIIKNIRFDYFDADQTPFTARTEEEYQQEVSEMRQTRKNLYNHTLANQSVSGVTYSSSDTITSDYLRLISAILRTAAGSEGETTVIIESIRTYKESISLTEEISAVLEVTFISDDISDMRFDIFDMSGNSVSNTMTITEIFAMTPEEFSAVKSTLMAIPEENILKKENDEEILADIFEIYNTLASRITKKHIPTEFNYKKLF